MHLGSASRALVAENLRRLLRERGLSASRLSALLGVNQGVVSKWLTATAVPSFGLMDRLSERLEMPVGELFRAKASVPESPQEHAGDQDG